MQQTPTCAEHSIPQTKLIYWQHPEGCRVQQTPTCAEHSIPQTKLIYWQHSGGVECSIPQTKLSLLATLTQDRALLSPAWLC